jgi:hypothetical protein
VPDETNRRVGLTVPEPMVEARRRERPPVRATTELGSVLIRDPRVWHRGTPNTSGQCRFMLALTYDPRWRVNEPFQLPEAVRPVIGAVGVDVRATYVDGAIDHLRRHPPAPDSPLKRARPVGAGR